VPWAAGQPARAATQPAELPSPASTLTAEPPLRSDAAPLAQRFLGRLDASERIDVRLTSAGRVLGVDVLQRFVVGRGDYSFAVAAPVEDVAAAPGSESEPGLRRGAVLWQGFSAGRKRLAATLRLDPTTAAPVLPLRVALVRAGPRRLRLTIVNVTPARVSTYSAAGVPASVAAALDTVRRGLRAGIAPRPQPIEVRPPISRRDLTVGVPFRVRVAFERPAGARVVTRASTGLATPTRGVIPGGRRATVELTLAAEPRRLPAVRVTSVVVAPLDRLEPPGAPSWRALVRRGGAAADGRRLLDRSIATLLGIARARQFDRFVANPDPAGRSRATYVFRLAPEAATRAAAPASSKDGSGAGTAVLVGGLLLLGLVGAAIAWAHA
jgi:hypothetical protein